MAETGNSIAEKESDVGKQVISGGTSGEQILNPNDDDQSVDEMSQTEMVSVKQKGCLMVHYLNQS